MDLNFPRNFAKIQTLRTERQDRISSLPDGILSHVLSFLPTKSAAQTVILSKRWKHPWLSVAVLDFDLDYQADALKFTHFMDRLFRDRGNSSIRKFRLVCVAHLDPQSVCSWLNSIAMRDVEELELNINCTEVLKWSSLNFAAESVKVMKLHWSIDISRLPIFHNLLHLEVTFTDLGYDVAIFLPSFLEASPVLQTLMLPWVSELLQGLK